MEFFQLTVFLSVIGASLRNAFAHSFNFLVKLMFMSYSINSKDNDVYVENIIIYIDKNLFEWQTHNYNLYKNTNYEDETIVGQKCELGDGLYFFWYNRSFMWVYISVKDPHWQSKKYSFLTIMTFRWNHNSFMKFFNEISKENSNRLPIIYYFSTYSWNNWKKIGYVPKRKISSVILPQNKINLLIEDIKNFFKPETKKFYQKKGINYKRGYLFYGQPGCGKTSMIKALTYEFKYDIYMIDMNGNKLIDELFLLALRQVPSKSIVIFEDIDVAFPDRKIEIEKNKKKKKKKKQPVDEDEDEDDEDDEDDDTTVIKKSRVTMKGFLNAIDGIHSNNNGVIYIYTTNHIEHLDPALLRAGRMDIKIEFLPLTSDGIRRMFLVFYPNKLIEAEKMSKFMKHKEIIPADWNEFLIQNMNQPIEIIMEKIEKEFQ